MSRGVTVTVPKQLRVRLEAEAARRQVTPAELIERALEALAEVEANGAPPRGHPPLWEDLVALGLQAQQEDGTPGPADLAEQADHYVYGTPKR